MSKEFNGTYTLTQFNLLSKGRQMAYLWEKCHFIMVRVENGYRINLYGCIHFYAEVWYKYGRNTILKIGSFNKVKYLEPYLDKIDINEILLNE